MAKTTWEYAILTGSERLAELGEEGWELVSVIVKEGAEQLYLKRPTPSIREQITLSQRDHVLKSKGGATE